MVQSVANPTKPRLNGDSTQAGDERPLIGFGREICGDLAAGLHREWLVTNGLGGYASGTLAGVATRRYHGLLVAALTPPVGRTVLVGAMVEHAEYDGHEYPLSAHEFGDGVIAGHGYRHLQAFHLAWNLPVWVFALGDALLERRIWMAYGKNTTYLTYRLLRGTRSLDLRLRPLVTYRDFHALTGGDGWQPEVEALPRGAVVHAGAEARPFRLLADGGSFAADGMWYWNFHHREEAARASAICRPSASASACTAFNSTWASALNASAKVSPGCSLAWKTPGA